MTSPIQPTFLRDGEWLNSGRVRAYSAIVAVAFAAMLAVSYVKAMGPDGTDFMAFWGAGKSVLAGHPAFAYDTAYHAGWQTAHGARQPFAFVNPPPFLFAVVPFALLPLQFAWLAWVLATFALWALPATRAFPRLWPIALVWPGALIAAGHGQNGLLTGALLIGAVLLVDRRPVLSGVLIGALVIKPHLALLMPIWLAADRRWRTFAAAGISAVSLMALSWLAFGTDTMLAYPSSWEVSRILLSTTAPDFFLRMCTVYSQLRIYLGHDVAIAVQLAVTLALSWLVWTSWRRFGGDALATGSFALAATALATPYLFNYDLPMLVLPTLWLVQQGLDRGFRGYEKLGLVALWMAPYATRAAALPLEVNLMPLASAAMMAMIWTRGPCVAARAKLFVNEQSGLGSLSARADPPPAAAPNQSAA